MLGVGESSGDKQLCVGKVGGNRGRGLGFPESFCGQLRAAECPLLVRTRNRALGTWGDKGKHVLWELQAWVAGSRREGARYQKSHQTLTWAMGSPYHMFCVLSSQLSGPESTKETVQCHQCH